MDYMMLNDDNECVGFVSDTQVMRDLKLTFLQFKRYVMYGKKYKGYTLIEDESCSRKWEHNNDLEYRLIAESKEGWRWYAVSNLTVMSVSPKGSKKVLKTRKDGSVRVNGNIYYVNRICYETFHDMKLPRNKIVKLTGEKNIKNLSVHSPTVNVKGRNKRAVTVDGVVYDSLKECSNKTYYTVNAISRMLRETRKNTLGVEYVG